MNANAAMFCIGPNDLYSYLLLAGLFNCVGWLIKIASGVM